MIKIVFMGTPEFSVPVLEKLIETEYKPVAVFCAPDKPVGRKQILTPPPSKVIAQKNGIPVYQPVNKKELTEMIGALNPDLIVSAAFGIIVPKEVLDAPKFGCLNIHPSLLPEFRGASPIQYTILNGHQKTGVTIFKMDEGMDTGPIVACCKYPIANSEYTTPELSEILAKKGADLLMKILPDWISGKIKPQPQDDSKATYTKIIKKEDGRIDWKKTAQEIEQQIRAFTPWPGSYSCLKKDDRTITVKLTKARAFQGTTQKQAGEIYISNESELMIQCGEGALLIQEIQLEGGKPMDTGSFLRGHREVIGQVLA